MLYNAFEFSSVSPFLLLVSIPLVGFAVHYVFLSPLAYGPRAHIPGPRLASLSWYYLSYFDLKFVRNNKISEWHRQYGPVVRIRPNEVSLGNSADYREIYDTKSRYDKTTFFQRFRLYGQDNLFSMVKYSDHQKMKYYIAGAYKKGNVIASSEAMVRERVDAVVKEITSSSKQTNGRVDFFVLFDCYAHDVMTRFLYGETHGTDAICSARDRPLVVNLKRSQIWTPLWLNFEGLYGSWVGRYVLPKEVLKNGEHGQQVKTHIEGLMREHDQDARKDEQFSLYRYMRQSGGLTRAAMASEMFDDLKAGQMTTASTLTYIFWRLSRHLEWQERLQGELRALPVHANSELGLDFLERCPTLEASIKETMRLHPAASGRQERVVPVDGKTFSGVYVPGGTTVIGPTLVLHLDPEVYDNPMQWRPERWLDADEERLKKMEFSYVPFGHGARVCIGQHLAMMEIRLIVATIYRSFTTRLSETCTDYEMHQLGTLAAVPRGLRCELYVSKK